MWHCAFLGSVVFTIVNNICWLAVQNNIWHFSFAADNPSRAYPMPSRLSSVCQLFLKTNKLSQFLSYLSDIWLSCAQRHCPKTRLIRMLIRCSNLSLTIKIGTFLAIFFKLFYSVAVKLGLEVYQSNFQVCVNMVPKVKFQGIWDSETSRIRSNLSFLDIFSKCITVWLYNLTYWYTRCTCKWV